MSTFYCGTCHQDATQGHESWCPGSDPGGRPADALLSEEIDAVYLKIERLAAVLSLPPDWDPEAS